MKTTIIIFAIVIGTVFIMNNVTVQNKYRYSYYIGREQRHHYDVCADSLDAGWLKFKSWIAEQRKLNPNENYTIILDSGRKIGVCV